MHKKRTFHLRKRKIYTNRWSTVGSPLGSVLVDIYMGKLERMFLPTLIEHVQDWHRYVDDMITTVKNESTEHVNNMLKLFHTKIQFTHKIQSNNKIPFLDVLIIPNNDNGLSTTVYRKSKKH